MQQQKFVADKSGQPNQNTNPTGMEEVPGTPYQATNYDSTGGRPGVLDSPNPSTFSNAVQVAWRYKLLLAIPMFIACLAAVAVVLYQAPTNSGTEFQYRFQLTFNGAEERQYPNGETFNLQDIIAPNVINVVYRDIVKDKSSIDISTFQSAFSITAYSPSEEFIISKYRSRLSNRRLTFVESNRLQAEMEAELNTAIRQGAILSFDNSATNLAPDSVKLALEKTVQEWNRYATQVRGVQKLNLALMEASFINESSVGGGGNTGLLRSIVVVHSKVTEYVNELSKLPIGADLRDSITGQTFESLNTRLNFVSTRIIELAKGMLNDTSDVSVGISNIVSSESFKLFPVENVGPQIAFEILLERLADARNNINNIRNVRYGDIVRDPESGLTVTDIANALEEIENFQIMPLRDQSLKQGLADDPSTLRTFYERKLADLQRQRNSVASVVSAIRSANTDYRSSTSLDGGAVSDATGPSARGGSAVIPQFDVGFLDRLIEVTGESKDSTFRQDLIKRTITLQENVSKLDSEIAVVNENLKLLEEGLSTPRPEVRQGEQNNHRVTINAILEQLKEQIDITVRISKRIALANSLSEVLVRELGLEENDLRVRPSTFLTSATTRSPTVPDLLSELQGVIEIANRIKSDVAVAVYGTNALFSPLAEPSAQPQRIFTRSTLMLMALMLILGLIASSILFLTKLLKLD